MSMALRRFSDRLMDMPRHWTTPYDELAKHIKEHVRSGKLCRYTGTLRWKVEGLELPPDPVELALDHVAFKRRVAYQHRRRERKQAGLAPACVKPKPDICKPDKWNASVRAEFAKMQEQSHWLRETAALAAAAGTNPH